MPIYEFHCKPCNDRFEVMTSFSRIGEAKCPKCGGQKIERLMSMFASRSTDSNGHSHAHGGSCSNCASGNCGSCGCH